MRKYLLVINLASAIKGNIFLESIPSSSTGVFLQNISEKVGACRRRRRLEGAFHNRLGSWDLVDLQNYKLLLYLVI